MFSQQVKKKQRTELELCNSHMHERRLGHRTKLPHAQCACHRHTGGKNVFLQNLAKTNYALVFSSTYPLTGAWKLPWLKSSCIIRITICGVFVCISHSNLQGYILTLAFLSKKKCCLNHTFPIYAVCVNSCAECTAASVIRMLVSEYIYIQNLP